MRLLLIAYEFPPSPSPQSLRWTYLVRELAVLGHEIHVLTADLGGETPGLPPLPENVRVHRTFPGPVRGAFAVPRKWRHRRAAAGRRSARGAHDVPAASDQATALRPPRNWKQQVSEVVQALAQRVWFPDVRGEWRFWAWRSLPGLLERLRPDLVISSHEPATTLELGLSAQALGYRWVADLGDPVLAGYVPRHWRQRAERVEQSVCKRADLITVTTPGTAELLQQRHCVRAAIEVLTQGFDASPRLPSAPAARFDPDRLELLYTGSFYRFRRVDALLSALDAHPALRLSIAAVTLPEPILAAARAAPDRIRLLGFLPHTGILELQRRADVLVDIANDDMTQVPGKFYEYLGAGRPILHLGNDGDPVATMLRTLHRGWTCDNAPTAIERQLAQLAEAKAAKRLDEGLRLGPDEMCPYSWQAIAERLDALLREIPESPARAARR